ncbi:hypothetical protein [Pandoraea sputorum]|uniref:hypothetical protein n=1 Tax=Pandoraea sputorum TaxID=93222 RepID=UPI001CD328DB|nr:hypothetical protein [Pandoraea sputorum]
MKKLHVSPRRSGDAANTFKSYRFPHDIINYAVWLYCRFDPGPISRKAGIC